MSFPSLMCVDRYCEPSCFIGEKNKNKGPTCALITLAFDALATIGLIIVGSLGAGSIIHMPKTLAFSLITTGSLWAIAEGVFLKKTFQSY